MMTTARAAAVQAGSGLARGLERLPALLPLLMLVSACAVRSSGQRPQSTPSRPTSTEAWLERDETVVAVGPVLLDHQRGLLLMEEGLASACSPPSEEEGPGPEICEPRSFRLLWRDLRTGRIVKVLRQGLGRTRGLHDAAEGRHVVLDLEGDYLGQPRSGDMRPLANGARRAQVFQGSTPLRAFDAPSGERFLCARLVPGRDLVALCVVPQTPGGVDFLTLEEGYRGLPSWGEVRLLSLSTGHVHGTVRHEYRPTLRSRPPCSWPVWTPEGWFSSPGDDGDCWAYDQACHQRRDSEACGRTQGWRDMPREQHMEVVVTPDGKGLTLLAFGHLHHYSLTPHPALRASLPEVTHRDRDHFLTDPQLTPGASGRRLVLHGRGRLLRVISLPGLEVIDLPVTDPFVTRSRGQIPAVPAAHLAADDHTLTYAAPDRSLRRVDVRTGRPLGHIPRGALLKALWTPDPMDPAVAWPWSIHRAPGRLLVVVAGRLLVLHPDTGAHMGLLGAHSPKACLWHPYGCD